jgi:hypothetical protein
MLVEMKPSCIVLDNIIYLSPFIAKLLIPADGTKTDKYLLIFIFILIVLILISDIFICSVTYSCTLRYDLEFILLLLH